MARIDPGPGSSLTPQRGMAGACRQLPGAFLINELLVSLHVFKGRCPEGGPHGVSSPC